MHRYLKMAMKAAMDHEYNGCMDYNLAALIIRGGSVLSQGFNKTRANSFVEHFASIADTDRDYTRSTCAEMDAVLKARGKIDLRGSTIYVVRRKWKNATYGMARPCCICEHILFSYGIKRAFYSIDDETYGVMKITNPALRDNNQAQTDQLITVSGPIEEK